MKSENTGNPYIPPESIALLNEERISDTKKIISLAIYQWKLGYPLEAIKLYESILLDEKYSKFINIYDWSNLGFICIKNNIFDKGIKYSNIALTFDECHSPSYDNIGQIYYKQQQYEEALVNFNKAINFNTDLSSPYYFIGRIYEDMNNYKEALFYYEKSLKLTFNPLDTLTSETVLSAISRVSCK